jgi:hypothetical protein
MCVLGYSRVERGTVLADVSPSLSPLAGDSQVGRPFQTGAVTLPPMTGLDGLSTPGARSCG